MAGHPLEVPAAIRLQHLPHLQPQVGVPATEEPLFKNVPIADGVEFAVYPKAIGDDRPAGGPPQYMHYRGKLGPADGLPPKARPGN